jgi:hypothetical protein
MRRGIDITNTSWHASHLGVTHAQESIAKPHQSFEIQMVTVQAVRAVTLSRTGTYGVLELTS